MKSKQMPAGRLRYGRSSLLPQCLSIVHDPQLCRAYLNWRFCGGEFEV